MLGSGRTVGVAIMVAGLLVACGGTAISAVAVNADDDDSVSQMMLWIVPWLIAGPIVGMGITRFKRGRETLRELETIKKQKKILQMIKPQGVSIGEIGQAIQANTEEVKYLICDLVNQDLFHGYIDQENKILHSKHKIVLQGATHCPLCRGEQIFDGKGIIECRHCDAEILL